MNEEELRREFFSRGKKESNLMNTFQSKLVAGSSVLNLARLAQLISTKP